MGITGELVRNAFSKHRSFGTNHDTNVMRNNHAEKKRWASVRSYLCGDEFSSVLAEEDLGSRRTSKSVVLEDYSYSTRTSKATVFSSRIDDESASVKGGSETTVTQQISNETVNDESEKTKLPSEDEAALVIQSAFRSFLARRETKRVEDMGDRDLDSVATSVEVLTGNSVVEVNVEDGSESCTHRVKHHKSARVRTSKLK
ncbi:protein IQ-DOMAIN 33-like, partial [Bidens hawaiensis]|uniref:protein IQ-DOMAIN 33-like n=1 Tax=Bidens hawaiensis TaxID=980011 RepID=UPI0040490AFF